MNTMPFRKLVSRIEQLKENLNVLNKLGEITDLKKELDSLQ